MTTILQLSKHIPIQYLNVRAILGDWADILVYTNENNKAQIGTLLTHGHTIETGGVHI